MNHSRIIGRVVSVDNYRVFIRIEDDLRGAYKNGVYDIYEIARINSYLIIPVGSDRVVALITRVTMKEEMELEKTTSSISLPSSARYISATMLGTIAKNGERECFVKGVYNFPSLDNPVWYVTEKDLEHIFDNSLRSDDTRGEKIDYANDFYLPIGTSPAFQGYKVKICPDQFFVKHAAILGNTGSGKSCTLTSILRNLFRYDFNGNVLENAHIVIFDTNGEYKEAFLPKDGSKEAELAKINAHYYGGDGEVKVPYWFMNGEDFRALLKPSDGVQMPVLNRAIGLAKDERFASSEHRLPASLRQDIEKIIIADSEELKKRTGVSGYGNWTYKEGNEIQKIGRAVSQYNKTVGQKIEDLAGAANWNNAELQIPIREEIKRLFHEIVEEDVSHGIAREQNIDLPTWFSYRGLCTKFLDAAISLESMTNNRIAEYVSTLRVRMNSFLNDRRIAVPLMLGDDGVANQDVLAHFIAFLLGDYGKCSDAKEKEGSSTEEKPTDSNSDFITSYVGKRQKQQTASHTHQITIVDMSQLPYEVLGTVTALIGRLIFEFIVHFLPEIRGSVPVVIVLEEAQNYIAEDRDSVARKVFERIAREGRKYGVSLIISSQRPSEISRTILSQCNSFVIHRLQNPDDQKYVRGLVSSANADLLEQLPIIPQQHAIITGDCVRMSVLVRIDDVSPTPNSNNPKYVENWFNGKEVQPNLYKETCKRWSEQEGGSEDGGGPEHEGAQQ